MDSPRAITKILVPSRRSNLLRRTRLIDFIHDHIDRKLLLVSASAGYGKTSLLVDFAHDTTLPVCWYSLDESDADPKTFSEYIITALQRQFPNFGARTLGLLQDAGPQLETEAVVGTLVTEMHDSIPGYFVLVLDDYHIIEESTAINAIVDSLLRLLPENAHLLLASRTLPSRLTLTRLTARQEIAGLGTNDLRFTADEIRAVVKQNYRVELTEPQAAELAEQSEGWITGILLTTHSLWKGLFQDLVRTHSPSGNVFNYLASEVFAQQPPELQRFLLDSSILDQLNPSFCDRLLGARNSQELLLTVEQKNLFITRLEDEEAWYRYHHLFQQFLQKALVESDANRAWTLHRRAADLYEAREAWDQAIAHCQKSGDHERAAGIIERVGKATFDAGHLTTLAKWIDALPAEVVEAYPRLIVWRAWIHAETGDLDPALSLYARAITILEKRQDATGLGRALVKQAICFRFQGRYREAIENCERALTLLVDDTVEIAEAHKTLGISYGRMGDLSRDIRELELALELYKSIGDSVNTARVHHDLGVAYRTLGTLQAEVHFRHAVDYWRRANNTSGLANTLNSIGVGYHRQGDLDNALDTLQQAREHAHQNGLSRVESTILASLGDIYRDQGEYVKAREAYEHSLEISQRTSEGFTTTYTLDALGETFRLMGDLQTAERLIHHALDQAARHNSNYELGLSKTELGILSYSQGNLNAAVQHLTDALELLDRIGAKRDSARAHLHLAQAHFQQKKYRLARQHLQVVAAVGQALHEEQFAVADGKRLVPLLQFAVSKRIGEPYFSRALDKVQAQPTTRAEEPAKAHVASPRIEARAFGTSSVLVNGKLVSKADWDSATTKELFFFLLAHPHGLRKEQIIEKLWSDTPPAKANGIFHSTAWRMRRALLPDCLVYADGLYRINDAIDVQYDAAKFVDLVRLAETETREEARGERYRQAIALYRGDYLEDVYSDWCQPIRAELHQLYLMALYALAHSYWQRKEVGKAAALYRKILDQDGYREDVYRELMLLHAASGNPTKALQTYQLCITALEEAHLTPCQETQVLAERIVRGESLEVL